MSATTGTRLPAAERRRALVEAALRVFSEGSYAGATTAQIAREAGVSEPILYRHFASKRELYFACLDEAWSRIRTKIEDEIAARGAAEGWRAMGPATLREIKVLVPSLWMQAVTEAGEDPEIRRFVRGHIREVHDFFADVLRRVQAEGGIAPERDPSTEAWIFVAGSLLVSIADRLGGPLRAEDFEAIKRERLRWLVGETMFPPRAPLPCKWSRVEFRQAYGRVNRPSARARAADPAYRGGNDVSPREPPFRASGPESRSAGPAGE